MVSFISYFVWYILIFIALISEFFSFIIYKVNYQNSLISKVFIVIKYLLGIGLIGILGFSLKSQSDKTNDC